MLYGFDGGMAEELAAEYCEGGRNDERFSALDPDYETFCYDHGNEPSGRDLTGWVLQPVVEIDMADVPF